MITGIDKSYKSPILYVNVMLLTGVAETLTKGSTIIYLKINKFYLF